MKKIFFFIIILTAYGCNKPKTVLICGDHVCVNKAEAKDFFEKNLTLEVKVIDPKKDKSSNLVEINLNSSSQEERQINIIPKKQTNKKLKVLSKAEIEQKKKELKNQNKTKRKTVQNKKIAKKIKSNNSKNKEQKNVLVSKNTINKKNNDLINICTILEKCSIDEISKYLVKQGNNKKFPDITLRENE